jgi:hypothetical protein
MLKQLLFFLFLFDVFHGTYGQTSFNTSVTAQHELSTQITYSGKFMQAVKWQAHDTLHYCSFAK